MVTDYLQRKSIQLMQHENKDNAKVGFPHQNYRSLKVGIREFVLALSGNVSTEIFDGLLMDASKEHSDKFGTDNAYDVIEALYRMVPWGTLEDYAELIGREQFFYVVEVVNGQVIDRLLRIDLFRVIKPNAKGGNDFIGGIFHALKHFSHAGMPLSTGKEIHDITGVSELVGLIAEAFFTGSGQFKNDKNYSVLISLDTNNELRLEFYFESVTGVYFLNTAFKQSKP